MYIAAASPNAATRPCVALPLRDVTGRHGPEVSRICAVDFSTASPRTVSSGRTPGGGQIVAGPGATQAGPAASGRRLRAVVKWFLPGKGYGFLEPEHGARSVLPPERVLLSVAIDDASRRGRFPYRNAGEAGASGAAQFTAGPGVTTGNSRDPRAIHGAAQRPHSEVGGPLEASMIATSWSSLSKRTLGRSHADCGSEGLNRALTSPGWYAPAHNRKSSPS